MKNTKFLALGATLILNSAIAMDSILPFGANAELDLCTRQISRGLPDNTDPILTPTFEASFSVLSFGVSWIFETTDKNNSKWSYNEVDYSLGVSFEADDVNDVIGLPVELGGDYTYEAHPDDDYTHYIHFSAGLPDLTIVPSLECEFELRNGGQYYLLSLSHEFELIEDKLSLTLSLSEGLANKSYNDDDLAVNKWGLRETTLTAELGFTPSDRIQITTYAAYGDIFNNTLRDAARYYQDDGRSHSVAQLYGGIKLDISFGE